VVSRYQVSSFSLSDPGLKRALNEDSCLARPDRGFFLVADGMGGAAAGEVASRIFSETVEQAFSALRNPDESQVLAMVKEVFLQANSRILSHVDQFPEHAGMGCTAELLVLHDDGYVLGHIGDSRSYRLRQGEFRQLSRDHSLVQEQIDRGTITRDEARGHRLKNVILRAVGVDKELAVDIIKGRLYPQDIFLLCTDGLSDMVADKEIQEVLEQDEPVTFKGKRLVELANAGGGRDNITLVLIEIL
jgi:serine/threonine protein phosphatase PrpC